MIKDNHPFFYLKDLLSDKEAIFYLSKYIYTSDSLMDDREIIKIQGDLLTEEFINKQILSLEKNQELALHSKVDISKSVFHIPMIDFSCKDNLSDDIKKRMRNFLPKEIMNNLALYNSGRSFHAYSTTLIKSKDWVDFMGRLLLINPKSGAEIIDSRWVGHRLIGGYCSLRWSNNTNQYRSEPEQIPFISESEIKERKDSALDQAIIKEQRELL